MKKCLQADLSERCIGSMSSADPDENRQSCVPQIPQNTYTPATHTQDIDTTIAMACKDGIARANESQSRGAIGALTAEVKGEGISLGTGFKIGPDLILTAHHVVSGGSGILSYDHLNITFFPGSTSISQSTLREGSAVGLKAVVIESGKGGDFTNDWSILRVQAPDDGSDQMTLVYENFRGAETIPLIQSAEQFQIKLDAVEIWGFSSDCRKYGTYFLTALRGTHMVSIPNLSLFNRFMLWAKGKDGSAQVVGASSGLSGGPVFALDENGQRQGAIGLVTNGENGTTFFTFATRFWRAYQRVLHQ